MRKNGVHNGWDVTIYRQGLADGPGTSMYGFRGRPRRIRVGGAASYQTRIAQMMLFRLCFTIAIGLFALFAAPDAFAQVNRNGDDQPGLIARPYDEQLDPKWQKTVVFYRTTEPPGTIIVQSDQRYLYVVQAGGRARQPDGRACAVSRRHGLSHPRHQSAANDRQRRIVGMFPSRQ